MSYSFEYIDIILLAMIAGFIFLRLRGILGKRTGHEENMTASFAHESPPKKATKILNKENFDETAKKELASFAQVFSKGETPEEMKTYKLSELSLDPESMTLLNIMTATGMFDSKGQIRRLFQQGAIKLNGERKENCEERLNELSPSEEIVIKAGKKTFMRFLA